MTDHARCLYRDVRCANQTSGHHGFFHTHLVYQRSRPSPTLSAYHHFSNVRFGTISIRRNMRTTKTSQNCVSHLKIENHDRCINTNVLRRREISHCQTSPQSSNPTDHRPITSPQFSFVQMRGEARPLPHAQPTPSPKTNLSNNTLDHSLHTKHLLNRHSTATHKNSKNPSRRLVTPKRCKQHIRDAHSAREKGAKNQPERPADADLPADTQRMHLSVFSRCPLLPAPPYPSCGPPNKKR
jgi:hypothetical protein